QVVVRYGRPGEEGVQVGALRRADRGAAKLNRIVEGVGADIVRGTSVHQAHVEIKGANVKTRLVVQSRRMADIEGMAAGKAVVFHFPGEIEMAMGPHELRPGEAINNRDRRWTPGVGDLRGRAETSLRHLRLAAQHSRCNNSLGMFDDPDSNADGLL